MDIHPQVQAQLATLHIDPARPLLVADADEVLFHFMEAFEAYVTAQGFVFAWESYALAGNIRHRDTAEPVPPEGVGAMIDAFFAVATESMRAVEGAAHTLARLAGRLQIVVLSNVPLDQAAARRRALDAAGLPYPLVANIGSKGGVVASWAQAVQGPVFFVDDIPRNLESVERAAPQVHTIHFVAHPRLAALLAGRVKADLVATDWAAIEDFVLSRLPGAAAP